MNARKTNPDFMTGIPELLVLRLISRQPMNGYAVVQGIKLATNGELVFGEGSVYPILHRLESQGKLKTDTIEVNGRQRVVYSITAAGSRRFAESHSQWKRVVNAVDSVFEGSGHDARNAT